MAPLTVGRFAKFLRAVHVDTASSQLQDKSRSSLALTGVREQPSAKRICTHLFSFQSDW